MTVKEKPCMVIVRENGLISRIDEIPHLAGFLS